MRTIIIGPCRSGKSSLARELRSVGIPTFCGDPKSEAKDVEDDVTYLPEGLPISGKDGAAQWIADNWFTMPGPWCCESWVMARALRRWLAEHPQGCPGEVLPCDEIIVFTKQHAHAVTKPGQITQAKAVATVWNTIKHHFTDITETR